jgi:hypothetical protein
VSWVKLLAQIPALLWVLGSACLQRYYHLLTENVVDFVPPLEVVYDGLCAEKVVLSLVQRNEGNT